jgi:hypothetical protein
MVCDRVHNLSWLNYLPNRISYLRSVLGSKQQLGSCASWSQFLRYRLAIRQCEWDPLLQNENRGIAQNE